MKRLLLTLAALASYLWLIIGGTLLGVLLITQTQGLVSGVERPPVRLTWFCLRVGVPALAAGVITQWWLYQHSKGFTRTGFDVVRPPDDSPPTP